MVAATAAPADVIGLESARCADGKTCSTCSIRQAPDRCSGSRFCGSGVAVFDCRGANSCGAISGFKALMARSLLSGAITGLAFVLPKIRENNVVILDYPLQCCALRIRNPDRHDFARQNIASNVDFVVGPVIATVAKSDQLCSAATCHGLATPRFCRSNSLLRWAASFTRGPIFGCMGSRSTGSPCVRSASLVVGPTETTTMLRRA